MITKVLTLLILLIGFAVMVMVLRRLTQTAQQLAEMRSEMAKNDAKLQIQLEASRQQQEIRQLEAQQTQSHHVTEDSSTRIERQSEINHIENQISSNDKL